LFDATLQLKDRPQPNELNALEENGFIVDDEDQDGHLHTAGLPYVSQNETNKRSSITP